MWLLPTRGRPRNLARLIEAWAGAATPVWLRLDDNDPALVDYLLLRLPVGWEREIGHRLSLGALYNGFRSQRPALPWYGALADDVVPVTPGWDRALIEAAGADGMAVPSGGETTGGCPHFVLGGDLVRSVGWLALPGLERLYIDTVWERIAEARAVLRRCPDVRLEHRHFSNRLSLFDPTYRKPSREADRAIYEAWKKEGAAGAAPVGP